MKIRIKGNSVRYRLTRPEVEAFSKNGYLEECTEFSTAVFRYALKAKPGITELDADFDGQSITMYFPDTEKQGWFESERVGYRSIIKSASGASLALLLEKDFVCLDDTEEDQSQNYPNPNAAC